MDERLWKYIILFFFLLDNYNLMIYILYNYNIDFPYLKLYYILFFKD